MKKLPPACSSARRGQQVFRGSFLAAGRPLCRTVPRRETREALRGGFWRWWHISLSSWVYVRGLCGIAECPLLFLAVGRFSGYLVGFLSQQFAVCRTPTLLGRGDGSPREPCSGSTERLFLFFEGAHNCSVPAKTASRF